LPGFERTLFVLVSDHGEGLGDHKPVKASGNSRWVAHGFLLYEPQVLVPLVLYATDESLPRGKVVETRSRLLDLMPTLLGYLGIEEPPGLSGESMMAAVNGEEPPELPSRFVVETEFRTANAIGVYGPRWEYFEHRAPHRGTDPRELQKQGERERGTMTNQLEAQPKAGEAMQAFLEQWESTHPKAKPTRPAAPLPKVEEEQLRALGYLE
jgi:arylsulfatase A-like enzyme